MARALILNDVMLAEIVAAVARARAAPVPRSFLKAFNVEMPPSGTMALKDRPPGCERPPSQVVDIPVGYRAAFSFENQPVGLVRHLSVSVDRPGFMPSVAAFYAIAEAFGFRHDARGQTWLEEFAPGHHAVNLLQSDRHDA